MEANKKKNWLVTLIDLRHQLWEGIWVSLEEMWTIGSQISEDYIDYTRIKKVYKNIASAFKIELDHFKDVYGKELYNKIYKMLNLEENITQYDDDKVENAIEDYKADLKDILERYKELHTNWKYLDIKDIDKVKNELDLWIDLATDVVEKTWSAYKNIASYTSYIMIACNMYLMLSSMITSSTTLNKGLNELEETEEA